MSEPDFSASNLDVGKTISTSDWASSLFGQKGEKRPPTPARLPETADLVLDEPPPPDEKDEIKAEELVAPDLPHEAGEQHPLDEMLADFLTEGSTSKSSPALVGKAMDLFLEATRRQREQEVIRIESNPEIWIDPTDD